MASLIEVATRIMDLYYQDYTPNDRFLDIADFKFQVATTYSTMLNSMFQQIRKENKLETSFSNVEINTQWLITQAFKEGQWDDVSNRWYIELEHNVFSFDFDAWGNGLNGIRPYGNSCNLKKISNQEIRFHDIIPQTPDIYYFLERKNRVDFLKKPTFPLTSYYIPEIVGVENDCVMSDNIVPALQKEVLMTMFQAKNGNFIQKLDDQNKNIIPGQQVNPDVPAKQ